MSEVEDKRKHFGESALSEQPKQKLIVKISEGAITEEKIAKEAVTTEKLAPDVKAFIQELINKAKDWVVQPTESGDIYFAQDTGNNPEIGISQKKLTEIINGLKSRLNSLEGRIIPFFWGLEKAESPYLGSHYYDYENEILYESTIVVHENEGGNEYEEFEWNPVITNDNSLYVRWDTLGFYRAAGTDGPLYPYYEAEIHCDDISNVSLLDPIRINAPLYIVYGNSSVDGSKIELGTLSIFQSNSSDHTITQLFTTPYIPETVNGDLYWGVDNSYGEYPKTYYRNLNLANLQWTKWKEVSVHVDIDNELKANSENPVQNSVITAKFEEVDGFIEVLQGADEDVKYFDDYDESENVNFMPANSIYRGRKSNGSIVYMVNYNVFAFKTGLSYYLVWDFTTGEPSSTEYNMEDEDNPGEYIVRKDKNFLLLAEEGGLPFNIDYKLDSDSTNPVQNKVLYEKFASLEPMILNYWDDDKRSDTEIVARIDYRYEGDTLQNIFDDMKDAVERGANVILKPKSGQSNAYMESTFVVTQFHISDNDTCIGTAVGSDGFYSIFVTRAATSDSEYAPESLTFRRDIAFDKNSSMADKSMLLVNNLANDRGSWVGNSDGTYIAYDYTNNKMYSLDHYAGQITSDKEITPSMNIIYVDPKTNNSYRCDVSKSKLVSIGGGCNNTDPNTIDALRSKIAMLETLLGYEEIGEGNNKTYQLNRVDNIEGITDVIGHDIEGETYDEDKPTLTARLIALENNDAGYVTSQSLEGYATVQALKEGLETKADKGHKVVILSYYQSIERMIVNAEKAQSLYDSMPNGIYWIDPTAVSWPLDSSNTLYNSKPSCVLYKGLYSQGQSLSWQEELFSEEALYIDAANKKMYVYKDKSLVEVSSLETGRRKVKIIASTDSLTLGYKSNEEGYEFSPRDFYTDPDNYESRVVVTITEVETGNEDVYDYYEDESVLLTEGKYIVKYSIGSTNEYIGDEVTYEVEIFQEPADTSLLFDVTNGNRGAFYFGNAAAEEIDAEDVLSYGIPDLYPEAQINGVYKVGPQWAGEPHIWTAEEAGLRDSVAYKTDGKYNSNRIAAISKDPNCIGIKLDKMYMVYRSSNPVASVATSDDGYTDDARKYKGACAVIEKDFIIDGEGIDEVTGEPTAIGGFYIWTKAGNMFYTEHSLVLNKVRTSNSGDGGYYPYFIYADGREEGATERHGVDQVIIDGCKFDHFSYSDGYIVDYNKGTRRVGVNFTDSRPVDAEGYAVNHNYINHILVKDCYACGNALFSNGGYRGRVVKSFRIVNNTVYNATGMCIEWGSLNSDKGDTYHNWLNYMCCPVYIVGNTFQGVNDVVRAYNKSLYRGGVLIESGVVYFLHNTIQNFISADGIKNGTRYHYSTYDIYCNCIQLYHANNNIYNLAYISTYQPTSGITKSKTINYPGENMFTQVHKSKDYGDILPAVRYYKANDFINTKSEILAIWNNRTIHSGDAYADERSWETSMNNIFDELIGIKFDSMTQSSKYTNWYLKNFTFSGNTVDAGNGRIIGFVNTTVVWRATEFNLEGNTFKARKMTSIGNSEAFNNPYTPSELYNYQNNDVWLFTTWIMNYHGTPKLVIKNNTFEVSDQDPETIKLFVLKFGPSLLSEASMSSPKPSSMQISGNTFVNSAEGSELLMGIVGTADATVDGNRMTGWKYYNFNDTSEYLFNGGTEIYSDNEEE